jgi:hypothetical protein
MEVEVEVEMDVEGGRLDAAGWLAVMGRDRARSECRAARLSDKNGGGGSGGGGGRTRVMVGGDNVLKSPRSCRGRVYLVSVVQSPAASKKRREVHVGRTGSRYNSQLSPCYYSASKQEARSNIIL